MVNNDHFRDNYLMQCVENKKSWTLHKQEKCLYAVLKVLLNIIESKSVNIIVIKE